MIKFLYEFISINIILLLCSVAWSKEFKDFQDIEINHPFVSEIKEYKKQLNKYYQSEKKRRINNKIVSIFEETLPLDFHENVDLGKIIEDSVTASTIQFNQEEERLTVAEYITNNPQYIYALDAYLRGANSIIDKITLEDSGILVDAFNAFSKWPNIEKIPKIDKSKTGVTGLAAALVLVNQFILADEKDSCKNQVTLTTSAASIDEDAGTSLTLTATLDDALTNIITLSFTTSGTATEGTDYATISNITISAGDTTGTASFTPTDDSVAENPSELISPSESATISMSASENICVTGSPATILINDDEASPVITLATSATSIAENSGSSLTPDSH